MLLYLAGVGISPAQTGFARLLKNNGQDKNLAF
jgi:hypothetical protein